MIILMKAVSAVCQKLKLNLPLPFEISLCGFDVRFRCSLHFFLVFERDMNDLQSLICLENATTCTERLLICQEENIGHWRHI